MDEGKLSLNMPSGYKFFKLPKVAILYVVIGGLSVLGIVFALGAIGAYFVFDPYLSADFVVASGTLIYASYALHMKYKALRPQF